MPTTLTTLSLAQARRLLQERSLSAEELARACAERIAATGHLNTLVTERCEQAIEEAKQLDCLGPDAAKPLWGIPLTVKDVLSTAGIRTTCASRILENYTPVYNAFAVERLAGAGALLLGKNNMDEFAMGSSTEHSAFGPTLNPHDPGRVPGGSSGGSAASVAAGQCFGSLGTDTGGSVRQPASLCGCVGLKPTYGRISRYGLIAYGSSLDQIGPFARTVEDVAILLQTIAGHDPRDSTCAPVAVPDYSAALQNTRDLKGIRIGVPAEYWGEGLAPEVRSACESSLQHARDMGAKIVDISLPHSPACVAAYYVIASAEASSNLARYDGVRYGHRAEKPEDLADLYTRSRSEGFGAEVRRRILLGTYVLSSGYYDAYYKKAAKVRRLIRDDFTAAFEQCDIIAGPTSPVTAWKLGEFGTDPIQMYLQDIFTISINLAGLPGLSLPVGKGADSGMPVGLQIIGRPFDESGILKAAYTLEQSMRVE